MSASCSSDEASIEAAMSYATMKLGPILGYTEIRERQELAVTQTKRRIRRYAFASTISDVDPNHMRKKYHEYHHVHQHSRGPPRKSVHSSQTPILSKFEGGC